MSLLNWPFEWLEKAIFNKQIKAAKVKSPIFILGHPRSGTTFLHYVFSQDPALAFCNTADSMVPNTMLLFGKMMAKIVGKFMPETRPQDNVRVAAHTPKEEEFALANMAEVAMVHGYYFPNKLEETLHESVLFSRNKKHEEKWKKAFHYLLQKLTLKNKGKRLVLKSPFNTARINQILALYPDAVFVHIHRNPYAVYQSNINLYERVLPMTSLQKADEKSVESFVLESYKSIHQKFLAEKMRLTKHQLVEVTYADFIENPLDAMRAIYAQLGIDQFALAEPFFKRELAKFNDYKTNNHIELSPEAVQQINKNWGFFFAEYGYKMR